MEPPCLDIPERLERLRGILAALGGSPPNVLLLEGGLAGDRETMALFWAARLNCTAAVPPCLSCTTCRQVAGLSHRDLHFLDGKQDKVGIDAVREVRAAMGQPPKGEGVRVIVISEAQNLTQEAGNALLKSLEEPLPNNAFVLLVPQREWLLPTLVSRSWVFTLGWSVEPSEPEDMAEWEQRLIEFWTTGRGLFQHTGAKDKVDARLVRQVVTLCQRALISALNGQGDTRMDSFFQQRLSPAHVQRVDALAGEVQECLTLGVNPSLVLDWFALTLRSWVQGG